VIARLVCALVGAAVALVVWIVTGYADPAIGAVLVPVIVGAVCYLLGPALLAEIGIEAVDDW
jgi:hypothetical protein